MKVHVIFFQRKSRCSDRSWTFTLELYFVNNVYVTVFPTELALSINQS